MAVGSAPRMLNDNDNETRDPRFPPGWWIFGAVVASGIFWLVVVLAIDALAPSILHLR